LSYINKKDLPAIMKKRINLNQYFQKIYVINLPLRNDRRREIEKQLESINLSLDTSYIELFSAIKPDSQCEFESIGAKGCFLSHLAVLKNAQENKFTRILILEDDVNFTKAFSSNPNRFLKQLDTLDWNIFYGGHLLENNHNDSQSEINLLEPSIVVQTSHFIGFKDNAIDIMIEELELMLSRKNGDPKGGPMHVDGAYSTIREKHPKLTTYAAFPSLGYQRSSRTDIHQLKWFDQLPLIRFMAEQIRKLKNTLWS